MKESEKVHFASKKARKKQGGVVIFLQSFCKEAVNDRLLRRKELFLQLFSVCRRSFPVKWGCRTVDRSGWPERQLLSFVDYEMLSIFNSKIKNSSTNTGALLPVIHVALSMLLYLYSEGVLSSFHAGSCCAVFQYCVKWQAIRILRKHWNCPGREIS